ncbi:indole-2-monooxygenase-like [Oryza brachyantha]|uniref:P450 n=1 Tax=Oryza brachyantha TaxID=4533 RepID=J3MPM3_ORYBR|nr:indole-2-monooxygenase-like [Oryza brachyantha]
MAQMLALHPQASTMTMLYNSLLLTLLCTPILLLVIHCYRTRNRSGVLDKLPSPPGRLPVIGHMHLISSLPHMSLRDLATKHGPDLMLLHLGAVPTLVVSSSRTAQAILRTHDSVFASRSYSAIADILFYGTTDVAFSPYGEYWRQIKKIVTTHLLTVKKVHSYGRARQQEVRLVMAKIASGAAMHVAVDLTELLGCYSNNMVCHAVSGKFFHREGRNQLFQELIEINSSLLGGFNLEDYFPILARLPLIRKLLCAKAHDVNRRWDQLLDKIIDDHTNKQQSSSLDNNDQESDFIDVLLSIQHEYGLTRDSIKANLIVMFEAGIDTSSIEIEYAMVELIRNPKVMAKLQNEVRSIVLKGQEIVTEEQLSRMPYLKAVIKETLRLHPAAPLLMPHLSMVDCNVEGYTIPSGTRVIVNAWALSREPGYWDNAEEFMPERFFGNTMADYNGNDLHFLPFGTGRRICPGINFAITAIEIMLANLVYRYDWKLPIDQATKGGIDMTETFGISVHRKEKLCLVPHLPQDN